MTATVVLLVIVSALAHASWNAILKRCQHPENAIIAMMTIAGMSSTIVALVLRTPVPGAMSTVWCLVSGILEAGYFVTLARALSRAPLGSVYTVVRGGALVIVWPVSIFVLGERLTITSGAGTVLVVLGLAATGASGRFGTVVVDATPESLRTPSSVGPQLHSGLAVAALCASFVGGYHLAYKLALSTGGRPEAVVAISLVSATLLNISMLGPRRPLVVAALRQQPVRIAIGGLLASGGFIVFLTAMKGAGAGSVLTLRNTSILFAQILAFALGERPKRLGVIGAVLVTLGAVLLSF